MADRGNARDEPTAIELQHKLNHHLRIIGSFDAALAVRRHAVTQLLDTISICLEANVPSGSLRQALSSLLTYIGHSDSQIRGFLLEKFHCTRKASARQIILDFLPATMPMANDEDDNNDLLLESSTQDVMKAFRFVLNKDPSALLPVIGCLSGLNLTEQGRKESLQMALNSLQYVSESDLPVLAQAMLNHAKSEEEALLALEALRTELQLMEEADSSSAREHDNPLTMVAHVVLNALFNDENGNQTAKAYCSLLERIISEFTTLHLPTTCIDKGREKKNTLLLLDMTVVLVIHRHPDYIDTCEQLLDALLKEGLFPFDTLNQLILLACKQKKRGRPTSILYPRLIQPLVSMGIFLMLAPARLCSSSTTQDMSKVLQPSQDFILHLHHQADRDVRAELVHTLLQLSDALATNWTAISKGKSRKRCLHKWELLSSQDTPAGKEDSYEDFQLLIDGTVHFTLQALAKNAKQSFSSFKHILIERLTKPSLQSSQWEQHSTRHLCGILSSLFEPEVTSSVGQDSPGILQTSEIMIILQKLLFTSSYSVFASSRSVDNKRVVRGLMLATELIQSPCVSHGDFDCVKQWVLRILLPTTRRMADPEIGTPGLRFLKALMLDRHALGPHNGEGKTTAQQKKEVFQHMKLVLANTGLIQILSHYQQQSQRAKQPDAPILAYLAKPDDMFRMASATKRKKRDMVFCLAFFLRNTELHLPSRWSESVTWVFHLVKTYLGLGREVSLSSGKGSSWMPHGWLQAAIEYPSLVFPRGLQPENKKQQSAVDWAKSLLLEEPPSPSKPNTSVCLNDFQCGTVDLLVRCEDMGQLRAFMESLMRLGLSSLLGISLSFAVVQNAFAHYQGRGSDPAGNEERMESLRLIQFQIAKIYDMQQKMEGIECLMKAALTCLQKLTRKCKHSHPAQRKQPLRPKDSEGEQNESCTTASAEPASQTQEVRGDLELLKELREQLELSLRQLSFLKATLFASHDFLGIDVLFQCLLDANQDRLIMDQIESILMPSPQHFDSSLDTVHQLVGIRQSLLKHAASTLVRDAASNGKCSQHTHVRARADMFASCADFGLYLCSAIPKMRAAIRNGDKDQVDTTHALIDSLSTLAASYLYVVFIWLASANDDGSQQDPQALPSAESCSLFSTCIETCMKALLRGREILGECSSSSSNSTRLAFAGFLLVLQDCEDAVIANQLLEILSLLACHEKESSASSLLIASWKVLHTVYVSTTIETDADIIRPFALVECLTSRTDEASILFKSAETFLDDAVFKRNESRIKQSLLRHWGVIALFPEVAETGLDQLLGLSEEISVLLGALNDPSSADHKGEEKKEDLTTTTTKGKKRQRDNGHSVPDLHGASFPSAFDTLFHIATCGMGILQIGGEEKACLGTKESGPYLHFVKLLRLFSSLLEIYQKKAHLFPVRTKSVIIGATKHLLTAVVRQLRSCVDWRNRQPLLSAADRANGSYDPGAIGYLQDFINECWTQTIVKVLKYCEFMRAEARLPLTQKRDRPRQKSARQSDDDESYTREDNEPLATTWRVNDKSHAKANALRYAVEKAARVFTDIAAAHNLTTPGFNDDTEGDVGPTDKAGKRKARRKEDEGFHQLDSSAKARQVADLLKSNFGPPDKLRRLSLKEDSDEESYAKNKQIQSRKRISLLDDELGDAVEDEWSEDEGLLCESLSGESDDDEDDDSSGGSFCAMGNWGGDDGSQSSSSGSLELAIEQPLF